MEQTSTDHVHRLVRSMTGPEKRYFKVYTARLAPSAHKNQQALFDAICAMETYDEKALLHQFQDSRSVNHFTTTKHRLYDAVLRSLTGFHLENSIDARLGRLLHQVEVLHDKALYDDAERMLISARRLARAHDRRPALLSIVRWEQRLLERCNYAQADPRRLEQLIAEGRSVLAEEEQVNTLWELKSHVFMGLYRGGQTRTAHATAGMNELLEHPLMQDLGRLSTARARFLFHHVHAAAAFSTGSLEQCMRHLEDGHSVLGSDRDKFIEEPNLAISTLSNLIYVKVALGYFEAAQMLLHEFHTLPSNWNMPETEDLDLKLFATSTSLELTIHTRMGAFDKALELLPVVERGMAHHADRLGPMRKAAFYYLIAYAYLGSGQTDKALRWINRLMNDIHMDESAEIVSFGRILNLLALLDAGQLDLLPYTLRNTGRFLSTRKRMHRFEPMVLAMVRGAMKTRNAETRNKIYRTFLEQLLPLEADPFERVVFDHLDPIAWVQSKLSGRPFAELAKERAMRVRAAA